MKSEMRKRASWSDSCPRRISGKTTLSEHPVVVTPHEALDGYREKTMRVASVENKYIVLCVNFVSRSTRHDALRPQRDVST